MVPEQLARHPGLQNKNAEEMINGTTSLVGLLGQPVQHSLSPAMHNAALADMKLDWCYLAMPCATQDLEVTLKGLRAINCKGLNITIPHKSNVAKLCTELSPIARHLEAVNTLIPNQKGGWTGTNTDVHGFLAPLKTKEWRDKKALVLGCGGSSRAVVAGLQELDMAEITVVSRTANKLEDFLKILNTNKETLEEIHSSKSIKGLLETNKENVIKAIQASELIVNTTPIGMTSSSIEKALEVQMPLGKEIWEELNPESTLYDLIYTPSPTAWLTNGAKKGCQQINGLEMLVQQGAASLSLWSDQKEIPIKIMRHAAENSLKI